MYITYKNVKEFVEQAPQASVVGQCGVHDQCLIARATHQKYPEFRISVGLPLLENEISVWAMTAPAHWDTVTTGDDGQKLYELGERFDRLAPTYTNILREEALELFNAEDIRKPAVSHHLAVPA